jgi:hypothetical protein
MPAAIVNVLLGAGVALVTREAVDARKAKRQRHAQGDAVVRAVQQELIELRRVLVDNVWMLRSPDDGGTLRRHSSSRTSVMPLHALPLRIDGLLRLAEPDELLKNRQALSLLSRIVDETSYINVLEGERMRFAAAQDPNRLRWAAIGEMHDEVVSVLDDREWDLVSLSIELFARVLKAQAVVDVIDKERRRSRSLRSRIGGSFYAPNESDRSVFRAFVVADEEDTVNQPGTVSTFALGVSFDDAERAVALLEHYGLVQDDGHGPRLTAQGRVLAGFDAEAWYELASPDPPEETFDWETFDAD